jgi:hypothetical protein
MRLLEKDASLYVITGIEEAALVANYVCEQYLKFTLFHHRRYDYSFSASLYEQMHAATEILFEIQSGVSV